MSLASISLGSSLPTALSQSPDNGEKSPGGRRGYRWRPAISVVISVMVGLGALWVIREISSDKFMGGRLTTDTWSRDSAVFATVTNNPPPSTPQTTGSQFARFDPLFTAPIPELKGIMEKTVGEALAMPSPEDTRTHEVAPTLVVREREETIAWTRRILKPEWIDGKAIDNWLAIRGGVQGRDGLFGAWKTSRGPLQIVATKRRIHVRLVLPKDVRAAPGPARIEEAASLAREIFQTDLDWSKLDWQVRDLGGFTFGYREIPFIANWWDSCLVVSDGTAVKFSFLKIAHRDSPSGRESGPAEDAPWFQSTRRPRR